MKTVRQNARFVNISKMCGKISLHQILKINTSNCKSESYNVFLNADKVINLTAL